MVSSLNGAVVVDGKSKPLSSPEDRKVCHALRAMADVVLVGAGTMREENYGPVRFSEEVRQQRLSLGLSEHAPVAVVTHEGKFDWSTPFFQDANMQPIILTDGHGAKNASEGSEYAGIVSCGPTRVDLAQAVKELESRGLKRILCEGGPSLNTDLLLAGVVDELCLTIAPILAGSSTKTIFDGLDVDDPEKMEYSHIFRDGGDIFLRVKPKLIV